MLYNISMATFTNINLFNLHDIIPSNLDISTKLTVSMLNVPQHSHSYYEILYIISGKLSHNFNGNEQILTEGDCILLTPNDTHSLRSDGFSVHRDILISKELFESEIALLIQSPNGIEPFLDQINSSIHFSLNELIELENFAQKFNSTTLILHKKAVALSLLFQVLTKMVYQKDTATQHQSIVDIILDKLNTLAGLQGGIPYLVKHLKYSESYLRHKFKKQIGIPLSIYIKDLRLNYIVYYLKNTNYSLSQIANMVGIESLPYLNKIFKEKYDIPPITYRRLHNAKHNETSN